MNNAVEPQQKWIEHDGHSMTHKPQKQYMGLAIEQVKLHTSANEGGPFGACIIKDNVVLSVTHNTVLKEHNPTKHAEINAIAEACRKLNSHDLSGCIIYSTTEPCPMCFSAIHWANISHVIYGTTISDVQKLGFNELSISNQTMKQLGNSAVNIIPDFQRAACCQLLKYWTEHSNAQTY